MPLTKSLPSPVPQFPQAYHLFCPNFPYIGSLPSSEAHSRTPAQAAFQIPPLCLLPPSPSGVPYPSTSLASDVQPSGVSVVNSALSLSFASPSRALSLPWFTFTVFFLFSRHWVTLGSWAPALVPWGEERWENRLKEGGRGEGLSAETLTHLPPSPRPSGPSLVPSRLVRGPQCALGWRGACVVCRVVCVCLYVWDM